MAVYFARMVATMIGPKSGCGFASLHHSKAKTSIKIEMATSIAPMKHAHWLSLPVIMPVTKSIATSDNMDDDWIKIAGHERSLSKKYRTFFQRVNEAVASVHKII